MNSPELALNQVWECPYGRKYKIVGEVIGKGDEADDWILSHIDTKVKDVTFRMNKAGGNFSAYCKTLIGVE